MTKAQELHTLWSFIETLPVDSYLRPWLLDVFPAVEQDIRSDFPVSPSLAQTRQLCSSRETECAKLCQAARDQARKDADDITRRAHEHATAIRSGLLQAIHQASRELTS